MPIYKSDLLFQLADYTASHKKILFRNPTSTIRPINTDIIFVGVDSLDIVTDFYGIEIEITKHPAKRGDDSVFTLKCLKTGSISTIVALSISIHENDLSRCESSLDFSFGGTFDNYWHESKNFKHIYPCVEDQGERSLDADDARKLVSEIDMQSENGDYKATWEFETTHVMSVVHSHDWEAIRKMVVANPQMVYMRFYKEWKTLFNELIINGADIDTLRFFIAKGADVNRRDFWGESPIFNAIRSGAGLDTIRFLFEHGARVDLTALNRFSILHIAAKYANEDVLEYLLSCGADPGCENHFHERPIDLANTEEKKEVLRKAMIARGVDPEQKNPYG